VHFNGKADLCTDFAKADSGNVSSITAPYTSSRALLLHPEPPYTKL
jgi:hypothetical protein